MERPTKTGNPQRHCHQNGFTYLVLLIVIAVMSVSLLALSEVWSKQAERRRQAEQRWVAEQYTNAIQSYYYSSRPGTRTHPNNVQQLLEDTRFSPPLRHLRSEFKTAFESDNPLRLVRDGSQIKGVEGGIPRMKDEG